MNNRKSLTKSLHTVTAVTRVALHLRAQSSANMAAQPRELVALALDLLGQLGSWPENDATVAACIAAVAKACK